MSLMISSHAIKIIMLTHTKLIVPPSYTSSFSFWLPKHSKYLTSLIKKFRDDLQKPLKGSHLLRRFSKTNNFFPKHSLQTWFVSRIHPYELPKLPEHKFALHPKHRNISIFYVNKLTMLFTRVQNSRSNSFQLGGHDTTHISKQITKDTRDTSHFDQSSQHPRQGPTKCRKNLSRRRTGHRPEHQMFFLLVFLQDKNVCK